MVAPTGLWVDLLFHNAVTTHPLRTFQVPHGAFTNYPIISIAFFNYPIISIAFFNLPPQKNAVPKKISTFSNFFSKTY